MGEGFLCEQVGKTESGPALRKGVEWWSGRVWNVDQQLARAVGSGWVLAGGVMGSAFTLYLKNMSRIDVASCLELNPRRSLCVLVLLGWNRGVGLKD